MHMIAAAARLCRSLRGCVLGALGLALLQPGPGLAGADPGLRIAPAAPDRPQQAHAYFAEQRVTLTLSLEDAATCPAITARLVQLSQRLEAEWDLTPRLNCPGTATPRRDGTIPFAFAVPRVVRQTQFEWRFFDCDSARRDCEPLLRLAFTAYPHDLLAPLRQWAENHVLVVKDTDGTLQDFLDSRSISFVERLVPPPKGSRVASIVVERNGPIEPAALDPLLARGDLVLFREQMPGLPHIKSVERGPHRLTTVEMVLLGDLEGSPLAQSMFLEIFQMTHEGNFIP